MTGSFIVVVIVVTIAIIGITAYFANNYHKELVDSGQIIKRAPGFEKQAEIFTLSNGNWEKVWSELREADYHGVVDGKLDGTRDGVTYTGAGWSAELYKTETQEDGRDRYYFQFLQWNTRNEMNLDAVPMNTLLTTVEKVFLKLDPQTKVATQDVKIKSKTKFL